jgi:hypothetical protein
VATSTIKNIVKELLDKTGIRPPARLTEEEIAAGKKVKANQSTCYPWIQKIYYYKYDSSQARIQRS